MAKVYVGDVGTEIRLDCNPDDLAEIDIATANTLKILVLKPSGEKLEELAKYKDSDAAIYAHPVVAGIRIFVKDADSLTLFTLE